MNVVLTIFGCVSQILVPDGSQDALQVELYGADLERKARLLKQVLVTSLICHAIGAVSLPRIVQLLILQHDHVIAVNGVAEYTEETLG